MYIFHISSALWCTMYDLCYTMWSRAGGFILLNSDGFVVFLWDFHQKNIRLWNIFLICLSMKLSYRPKYLQCFHGLVNYYILLPGLYMIGYGEQEKIFLNFEWGTPRAGNSNEYKNTHKQNSVVAKYNITLSYLPLDFPQSIGRNLGISKLLHHI